MSFAEHIERLDWERIRRKLQETEAPEVERVLGRNAIETDDLPVLFSRAARSYLEELARRSAALTERRFGRVIQLYAPLYVSNECVNDCTYCGFARSLNVPRVTLPPEQALEEARILHAEGFRHILLVSGERRDKVGVSYLSEVAGELKELFDSIAIEVNPMEESSYRQLVEAGIDGLVIYQETYDPELYQQVHPRGPKRHYRHRLDAIEAGGRAGMRSLGIGALFGLGDWQVEAVVLAMHGRYLSRRFWRSRIGVSFPRLNPVASGYQPEKPVDVADLVQMICGMRLVLPDAELVMSTREPAPLRDNLIGLGVTRMSAGSRTNPGGYSHPEDAGRQFEVEDIRSPEAVARAIQGRGFEPVWKDFDRRFLLHETPPKGGQT